MNKCKGSVKNVRTVVKKTTMLIAATLVGQSAWAKDIPTVPASVMRDGVPPYTGGPAGSGAARVNKDSVIVVESGVNQIVPIAVGHLNRLVTPFQNPAVPTVSGAKIEVKGNVVYLSTDEEIPVSIFITEKGDESRAINLTLIPQRIPPRELFLQMPDLVTGHGLGLPPVNTRAQGWETTQPYVETLRSLFRHLALGEIPQGYTMVRPSAAMKLPQCNMQGLSVDFRKGQVLQGHSFMVFVGVARNTSDKPTEIVEAGCADWHTAAVAGWPHTLLAPGQASEIYVAQRIPRNSGGGAVTRRPSLIGGY